MDPVSLVLCIHNHQPVGNLPGVFKDAYRRAYLPLLEAMERFPDIKFVLHNSGPLLEWYESEAPDYLERVRALVERGQVEVLGGAFYEPILPAVPERDAVGQMRMMTEYVADRFGRAPRGMWLAERVWEPRLAKTICGAGLEYLPLDDYGFRLAGIEEDDLVGPYLVEEQGHAVRVFPISKRLRYAIPFAEPSATLDELLRLSGLGPGKVAVFGDDGEKFGVWPGTHSHVHKTGWLNRFLKALSENSDWVRTVTFAEVLEEVRPLGRAYLPTSSYPEMMEWALPTRARRTYVRLLETLDREGRRDEWGPFLSGGTWKGFLSKYDESNLMVRKMMRVSDKVASARRASEIRRALEDSAGAVRSADGGTVVEPAVLDEAERELWMGQCNCAYWHGIFGGLYLPHLRTAVYEHLLRAERLLEAARGARWDHAEVTDHDLDGLDEVLLESHCANAYVAPARGGTIFELDDRKADWNALSTMARHEEAYHDEVACEGDADNGDEVRSIHAGVVVKDKGLERLAGAEGHPAVSAIDHFYEPGTGRSDAEGGARELGDFAWGEYEFELSRLDGSVGVEMSRTGTVNSGGESCPVTLEKRVAIVPGGSVRVGYDIVAGGDLDVVFASEWNLSFLTPDKQWVELSPEGGAGSGLRKRRSEDSLTELHVDDRLRGERLTMRCEPAAGAWTWPLETASHSEGGLERVFQGLTLLLHWPLRMGRGERRSFGIELAFSRLAGDATPEPCGEELDESSRDALSEPAGSRAANSGGVDE